MCFICTFVSLTYKTMAKEVNKSSEFRALRLKQETLWKLKDIRFAFESSYLERITNDELIARLISCVEAADPAVWENYCLIEQKKTNKQ